jgi:hypothetical protein
MANQPPSQTYSTPESNHYFIDLSWTGGYSFAALWESGAISAVTDRLIPAADSVGWAFLGFEQGSTDNSCRMYFVKQGSVTALVIAGIALALIMIAFWWNAIGKITATITAMSDNSVQEGQIDAVGAILDARNRGIITDSEASGMLEAIKGSTDISEYTKPILIGLGLVGAVVIAGMALKR